MTNLNAKEPAALAADYSNVKELGRRIYTTYLYPFELAAVLLLLAIDRRDCADLRKRKGQQGVDPTRNRSKCAKMIACA